MITEPVDEALPLPPELSPELHAALQLAFRQSLGSLDSLRIALRRYVRKQRNRGVLLGELDAQMRQMMAEVETPTSDRSGATANGDLTKQIAKWTSAFFSGTRKHPAS